MSLVPLFQSLICDLICVLWFDCGVWQVVFSQRRKILRVLSVLVLCCVAWQVKVLPWSTFRLNLSCTTPYNADFDG